MRFAALLIVPILVACGEEEPIIQRARPPGSAQATPTQAGGKTFVVHEVQMMGSPEIGFRFDPTDISIKVGDTVRWVNASGFPHNVAFHADSIPSGALVVIEAVMPAEDKLGPMIGRIVSELGDAFEMDFLHAPSGTYHYFSVPQEARGMVGTVTVQLQ